MKRFLAISMPYLIVWSLTPNHTARATDPRASDGGLNDLVIYLGSDHPRGIPSVEFTQIKQELRKQQIEIAPAIHVHRYYFNGNKEYQGPFVVGGPTVIVANHPRTNERLYMSAQLPSGYPSIAYDRNSITYVYPERRVEISFSPLHREKFRVSYLSGRGLARSRHEAGRARAEQDELRRQSSQFRQSLGSAHSGIGDVARGMGAVTGTVFAQGSQVIGQAISVVPGVRSLQSRGQQVEADRRAFRFRKGTDRTRLDDLEFEPTIR